MSKKRSKIEGAAPIPLRVPEEMRKAVRALAEKSSLSDADIMRLAIERGLCAVEKMFEKPTEKAA
jgi:predicted DNA-binding protein